MADKEKAQNKVSSTKNKADSKTRAAPNKEDDLKEYSLILQESLSLDNAESLAGELNEALSSELAILVDASAVKHADLSGLQLLVALMNSARANAQELLWLSVSDALKSVVRLARLDAHFPFNTQSDLLMEKQVEAQDAPPDDDLCPVF